MHACFLRLKYDLLQNCHKEGGKRKKENKEHQGTDKKSWWKKRLESRKSCRRLYTVLEKGQGSKWQTTLLNSIDMTPFASQIDVACVILGNLTSLR